VWWLWSDDKTYLAFRVRRGQFARPLTVCSLCSFNHYVCFPHIRITAPDRRHGSGDLSTLDDDDITAELLNSFAPALGPDGQAPGAMDLSSLVNVMQVARNLGIADMTPLGEALLFHQPMPTQQAPQTPPTPAGILSSLRNSLTGGGNGRALARMQEIPPARAKKELQFHAMLLSPHQIELLFVLCTLLSGRRKLSVQKQLATAGLDTVLLTMFDRMSWGVAPSHPDGGAQQHIHGPNCTCDSAGSPLRVQFLRLIHNFYDRDFLGNPNKLLMLSPTERGHVRGGRMDAQLDVVSCIEESGLMRKIITTLMSEPAESVYKFWLSACVENFLRGSGRMSQSLVAQSGALDHTLRHVVAHHSDPNASLQTSFDLLGEIVKCNHTVLAQLDALMTDEDFDHFRKVVMTNLIDSNVLLRSLYLTLDMVGYSYSAFERDCISFPSPTTGLGQFGFHMNCLGVSIEAAAQAAGTRMGYLRETWVEFEPTVLSKRALQQTALSTETRLKTTSSKHKVNRGSWTALTKSPGREGHPSRKGVDHNDEAQAGNTLSTIGSGVLGALKDIRSATKSFLRLGDAGSPSGKVAPLENSDGAGSFSAAAAEAHATADALRRSTDTVEGEYFDCRGAPGDGDMLRTTSADRPSTPDKQSSDTLLAFTPPRSTSRADADPSDVSKVVQEVLLAGSPAKSALRRQASSRTCDDDQVHWEAKCGDDGVVNVQTLSAAVSLLESAPSPQVPQNINRIAGFLQEEKIHVIVRLMSTVSLTTINHENICCLNTALMLILLDHKRFVPPCVQPDRVYLMHPAIVCQGSTGHHAS
jgi:hypothetical protein